MRHFSKILIFTVTVVILTLSLALAGATFENKDTAKNRKNNSFGTEPSDDTSASVIGTNEDGNSIIKSKAAPSKEEVDWYDKVIITVNPITKWPQGDGTTSSSTTTTGYDNSTDTQTTTTTTQENKNW